MARPLVIHIRLPQPNTKDLLCADRMGTSRLPPRGPCVATATLRSAAGRFSCRSPAPTEGRSSRPQSPTPALGVLPAVSRRNAAFCVFRGFRVFSGSGRSRTGRSASCRRAVALFQEVWRCCRGFRSSTNAPAKSPELPETLLAKVESLLLLPKRMESPSVLAILILTKKHQAPGVQRIIYMKFAY